MRTEKNKTSHLIVVFLVLTIFSSQAQKKTTVSYDQFMEQVLTVNPLSLKANNDYSIALSSFRASRGLYDPQIGGDIAQKQFDGKNYYTVVNSELKQPVFASQYLKAGFELGNGTFVNPEEQTSVYGLPYAGIEIGLLQGLTFDKRRAEYLKSKEYVNYYSAERDIQINDLMRNAATVYSEWLFVDKQLSLYEYFIQLARTRYLGMVELANVGERAGIDSVEAAINYRSRLIELQSAIIEYQKQQRQLNVYFQSFNSTDTDERFIASDSLESVYLRFRKWVEMNVLDMKISNPVVEQYASKQRLLEIEKRWRKELIKPKLDVKYNFLSGISGGATPVFSMNNYKWGASLSFPLFLTAPRNNYKAAGMEVMNNKLNMDFKNRELNNKFQFLKEALVTMSEQISNVALNASLSRRMLEAEKLKFYNGESSLFLVNSRENKWLENELKLNEYKLKFVHYTLMLIHLQGDNNYRP